MTQIDQGKDARGKGRGPAPVQVPASKIQEYVYVNFIFWGFLLVLCAVVYIDCVVSGVVRFGEIDEVIKQVFKFILLVFGGGFTAVSVFDYLYDRYAGPEETEAEEQEARP